MQIDLQNTKIVCISLKKSIERRNNFKELAERLNFKNWCFYDGVETGDHIEGCALSQINVLNDNLNDEPILILEDDVHESQYYNTIIDLTPNIDALYLGYSNWAADPIRAQMSLLSSPANAVKEGIHYRIKNVTSAHAILYVSKKYKEECAIKAKTYLYDALGNRHCDVVYAKLQNNFNVYGTAQPYFYQNCPRNKIWTETPIELP
jgi:hypothetical protein